MSDLPANPEQSQAPLPEPVHQSVAMEPAGPPAWQQLQPEEEGTDWRRYIAAVLRFKWLVVLTTMLCLGGGLAAARFVKPEYLAQAAVWIETAERGTTNQGPIQSGQLLQSYGWVELLKSFVVLDPAVQELRLYLTLEEPGDSAVFNAFRLAERFRPGEYRLTIDESGNGVTLETGDGIMVERAQPGDSLGGALGFLWAPRAASLVPGSRVEFSVVTPRDAAVQLRDELQTQTDRNGNFLRVELQGTNPALITATVNTVLAHYVEEAAELKKVKLTQRAEVLQEQLTSSERNLKAAEEALETFRIRTITLPSDRTGPVAPGLAATRDPVFSAFFNMRVERDQIIRDRAAIQKALVESRDSGLTVDAFEVVGAVQQSSEVMQALQEFTTKQAELRALKYRYTDEYAPVKRLVTEMGELERTAIPRALNALVAQLNTRQMELDSRIGAASRELRQIPPRQILEARYEREVTVADNLYTTLSQRYAEARLAEASSIPDVRVLDSAVVPEKPVKNRALQFIAMGLAAGIGLGLVGAILLDRVDKRVRYPDQVTKQLGLQLLGVIPHLKGAKNGTAVADAAPVVEALRGVRLNMVHAFGAGGPLVVTITSPGAGDGKSFVASNLALAFADGGHRTLLIDGDARRGGLHRALNANRKPGLTDLLMGRLSQADAIQQTGYHSLHFLGCGTRTPEAPELLGSGVMSQLIAALRSSYSVVIVDSPPLGAGVDAFSLGTLTGHLLMVLRLGSTDRDLAEAKLDVLDRLPVRVLGAVLNDVREGSAYHYYRYYSYYLPGYEQASEEGEEAKGLLTAT
ncbi:MAG: GumC family protein [Gemmatimonadales bacterium]